MDTISSGRTNEAYKWRLAIMKSLEELKAIREKKRRDIEMREDTNQNVRVVVGMATCGIAAGARPVLMEFVNGVADAGVEGVTVTQTGCVGLCEYEPIVEVFEPGKEKITYVKMTPDKAKRVLSEHLQNGRIVSEYTVGAISDNK